MCDKSDSPVASKALQNLMSTSECQVSDGRTAEPELCNQLLTFDAPDPRNLDIREQAAKVTKGAQATVQATVTPMFGFKFLFFVFRFLDYIPEASG